MPVSLVDGFRDADVVITTKTYYRKRPQALRAAEAEGVPIFVLRRSSVTQIEQYLMSVFGLEKRGDGINAAIREAEDAVRMIETGEESVALSPQSSFIRRLQHQTAERSNLSSFSVGTDPWRHVNISRPGSVPTRETQPPTSRKYRAPWDYSSPSKAAKPPEKARSPKDSMLDSRVCITGAYS